MQFLSEFGDPLEKLSSVIDFERLQFISQHLLKRLGWIYDIKSENSIYEYVV